MAKRQSRNTLRLAPGRYFLSLAFVVTLVEAFNAGLGRMLNRFAIYPRDIDALPGILAAPFLHADFTHFLSNLVPLVVLSYLLAQQGAKRYWSVTLAIIVAGGALVWLAARPAIHLGASGLIYGWFGYLVVFGLRSGRLRDLLISLVVVVLYSGFIWGMLPMQSRVSWESHLAGFVVGVMVAWHGRRL